jgi:hypothetical protein
MLAKPSASLSAAQGGTAGRPFVLALQGFVCDRYTSAGMHGAIQLARAAAVRLNAPLSDIGEPEPAKNLGWRGASQRPLPIFARSQDTSNKSCAATGSLSYFPIAAGEPCDHHSHAALPA